jgi:hypothetical protein
VLMYVAAGSNGRQKAPEGVGGNATPRPLYPRERESVAILQEGAGPRRRYE